MLDLLLSCARFGCRGDGTAKLGFCDCSFQTVSIRCFFIQLLAQCISQLRALDRVYVTAALCDSLGSAFASHTKSTQFLWKVAFVS